MEKRYKQLSLDERYTISHLHADGKSLRQISAALDRSPSTISREIRRNSGNQIGYKPAYADEQTWARRWRGSRLMRNPELCEYVIDRLANYRWSPEQISHNLRSEYGRNIISHESIYRFIYAEISRTKNYSLRQLLPKAKHKRGRSSRHHKPLEHIKHRVSIRDRPHHIDNRRQFGHWETDLMMLSDKKHNLLVLQERKSRFTFLAKQTTKAAQPTIERLGRWLASLPEKSRRSLTQDNGTEFFLHHRLHDLGTKTYFCDPRSPWQKGGVENMNGRVRRFIPLNTNPDSFSDDDIDQLQSILNSTPRKCLGFKTPAQVFSHHIQPLHFKCESTFPLSRE